MSPLFEHLRTIHFTLMAVATVILTAALFSEDSKLMIARRDVTAMQGLISAWNPAILANVVDEDAGNAFLPDWRNGTNNNQIALQLDSMPGTLAVSNQLINLNDYSVSLSSFWRIEKPDPTTAAPFQLRIVERTNAIPLDQLTYLYPPIRLKDFEDLWNTIEGGIPVGYLRTIHPETALLTWSSGHSLQLRLKSSTGNTHIDLGPLSRSLPAQRIFNRSGVYDQLSLNIYNKEFSAMMGQIDGFSGDLQLTLLAEPGLLFVDGQTALAKKAGANWRPGTFHTSFPQLDELFSNMKSVEISQAEAFLTTLQESVGKQVTILGVDLPAQALGVWALVLLLLIQIYFWLNLTQISESKSHKIQSEVTPWIGCYPSWPAKIATLVSTCLFPLIVIIIVRFRSANILAVGNLMVTSLLIISGGIIAVLLYLSILRLWRFQPK